MMKILVIDDHKLFAESLSAILSDEPDFEVLGICSTGKEGLAMLKTGIKVDVLLLDLMLPDMTGVEVCHEVIQQHPYTKVLIVSGQIQATLISEVIEKGALGYILKNTGLDELKAAIKSVFMGNTYFCIEAAQIMVKGLAKKARTQLIHLSEREREVLRLIAEGYTTQEISEKLFLSAKTIEAHRSNMLIKIGARNTASLIKMAKDLNLL